MQLSARSSVASRQASNAALRRQQLMLRPAAALARSGRCTRLSVDATMKNSRTAELRRLLRGPNILMVGPPPETSVRCARPTWHINRHTYTHAKRERRCIVRWRATFRAPGSPGLVHPGPSSHNSHLGFLRQLPLRNLATLFDYHDNCHTRLQVSLYGISHLGTLPVGTRLVHTTAACVSHIL